MKIVDIHTYILDFPQSPAWGYAKGWVDSAPAVLVELVTEDGLSGFGEAYGPSKAVAGAVESLCRPLAVGANPLHTERLWSTLYHHACDFGASGAVMAAISAVDIACWDIKGKAMGVPVSLLLGGGVRGELECYASTLRYLQHDSNGVGTPEAGLNDPVELAQQFQALGFRAIKMAVGLLAPKEDVRRVERVRQALPDTVQLMVDANHAYSVRHALYVGTALQDMGIQWFEDPLPPDDLPGYESLRARLRLPLAGGEALSTRAGYREVLTRRIFDILLPETGLAGGLTECKKIVDMAYAFGVECTPHGYTSAIGTAAAMHLAAAMPFQPSPVRPSFLPFEIAPPPFSRLGNYVTPPFEFADGKLRVPDHLPGLGVEIDRLLLQRSLVA